MRGDRKKPLSSCSADHELVRSARRRERSATSFPTAYPNSPPRTSSENQWRRSSVRDIATPPARAHTTGSATPIEKRCVEKSRTGHDIAAGGVRIGKRCRRDGSPPSGPRCRPAARQSPRTRPPRSPRASPRAEHGTVRSIRPTCRRPRSSHRSSPFDRRTGYERGARRCQTARPALRCARLNDGAFPRDPVISRRPCRTRAAQLALSIPSRGTAFQVAECAVRSSGQEGRHS